MSIIRNCVGGIPGCIFFIFALAAQFVFAMPDMHELKRVQPMDTEVRVFYYGLAEGTYSIETEYYLDRAGVYETGLATIVCEYAPEYRAVCPSVRLVVK